MISLKCNSNSFKVKLVGSECLLQSRYFGALSSYNASLALAEDNSQKSLIFANRSLVYLNLKQYENSLNNIKLAREHGYSADKLEKLEKRKEVCLNALKSRKPDENPWNFFKLSLPPYKEIPFIASCLKIQYSKLGRGIYTTKDLNPGDVIAVEEAFMPYNVPDLFEVYARCYNCMKSNMLDLFPCTCRCSYAMFCSEECEKSANKWNQHECSYDKILQFKAEDSAQNLFRKALSYADGDINKLRRILEARKQVSVFDFDLSDLDDPGRDFKLLQAFCSLHILKQPKEKQRMFHQMAKTALKDSSFRYLLKNEEDRRDMIDFTCLLLHICDSNHHPFSHAGLDNSIKSSTRLGVNKTGAIGFFPFFSLINHSCNPNTAYFDLDNQLALVVIRPIPAGSQILVSYHIDCVFSESERSKRQEILKRYGFICQCVACNNPQLYRHIDTYQMQQDTRLAPTDFFPVAQAETVGVLRKLFKILKESDRRHPSWVTIMAACAAVLHIRVHASSALLFEKL